MESQFEHEKYEEEQKNELQKLENEQIYKLNVRSSLGVKN